jgi:hypothetical protein
MDRVSVVHCTQVECFWFYSRSHDLDKQAERAGVRMEARRVSVSGGLIHDSLARRATLTAGVVGRKTELGDDG